MFNIYRMQFFSFEESQNGRNHSSSDTHHPIKNSPQQNVSFSSIGEGILPIPLNVIWKTLLGTTSLLCIFSSILNYKSSNQGIELQAKGSFQCVTTLQSNLKDPGSNPSGCLAVLRSILTRLFLPNLVTKLLVTYKSRMSKHSD